MTIVRITTSVLFVTLLLSVINCRESLPQQVVIKINPNQKFQKINGWEATAASSGYKTPAFNYYKEKIFNEAANDLGINRIRVEVRSGFENPTDYFAKWQNGEITESEFNNQRYEIINDNSDSNSINPDGFKWSQLDDVVEDVVLPLKKSLQARGESLWINANYIDFDSSTAVHRKNPDEYAEFVLAVFQHLKNKYGFVPDSWEIILEPDNANWSPLETANAVKAAGNLLTKQGFKPNFVVPSTMNAAFAPKYIDQIAQTPGAMQYVNEFSYHRYGDTSDQVLQAIAERAGKFGKQTAMLEWIGADYKALHQDLKIGLNSAWQQYTLFYGNEPDNGAQYYLLNDKNLARPTFEAGKRTPYLQQYFHYIRSGAQRVGAETSNSSFDPLAFVNPNKGFVVVIKADSAGSFTVYQLPAGKYGISFITQDQAKTNAADISLKDEDSLKTEIPSTGVLTIYAKN